MNRETYVTSSRILAISRKWFARQTVFVLAIAVLVGNSELFAADAYKVPDSLLHSPSSTNAVQADIATRAPQNKGPYAFDPLIENPPKASNVIASKLAANSAQSGTNNSKPVATNGMSALDDKYVLAIGDKLSFRIAEDEEDAKPLVVTDSGELEVPYSGRFPAVGKTCLELARSLKAELEKEYYYQATVIVAVDNMTKSRGRVYLVGPIRSPGPQEVPSDEVLTLSKAILRAGGFTDYADRRRVKVTRKNATSGAPEEVFTVNVEDVLEKGKIESDLPLRAGDLIYIPERLIRF